MAAATSDATGAFTLEGVPTGRGVPVTVQIGKWRRTVPVDILADCATTAVRDGTLRLPRSQAEGDMPQMALLTGGCDDMGCFMMNMGIAPAEFTAPHAGGRVDVYQGLGNGGNGASLSGGTAGNCTDASCPLWASKQSFEYYDMAILSCECAGQTSTNETAAAYTHLRDWLDEGGKVLASHSQYTWFENNPSADFRGVATWLGDSVASGGATYDVNRTFARGNALAEWLGNVGALASSGPPSTIALENVASSVSAVDPATTTSWIYDPSTTPSATKSLSFETPLNGARCGKAAFTDLHAVGSTASAVGSIPAGCAAAPLTPQQLALEFLFFDLSGCNPAGEVQPL